MIRGTTPVQKFTFSFDTAYIEKMSIVYCQRGRMVLQKSEADVEMGEDGCSFVMTQEESLAFREGLVYIQLKIKTAGGSVAASRIITTTAEKILDEEVM